MMSSALCMRHRALALGQDAVQCRLRLVCTLLDTCGSFFCKGKAGRRLDRFLAFFQRYLLAKPPLPLDIDFDVQVSPDIMPSSSPNVISLVYERFGSILAHWQCYFVAMLPLPSY